MFKLQYLLILLSLIFSNIATATPKTLIIATEATYPPFAFMDEKQSMQGFDIEITKALCIQMEAECEFKHLPWDSLIPSLIFNKIDAINGAMTITEQRKKQIDFSEPFYFSSAVILGKKEDNLLAKEAIYNKIIGYQTGTTFGTYLDETYGSKIIKRGYASEQTAFLDLIAGRLDLIIGDLPSITTWLKENHNDDYAILLGPIENHKYFGFGNAIAVQKGNKVLQEDLNKALQNIKSNGVYQDIFNKYFGNL